MTRLHSLQRAALPAAVALLLFWLAYDGGTYAPRDRAFLGIGLWWTVIVVSALGFWPRATLPRAAVAAGALLAGFACWVLLSTAWAPSAEDAVIEFNRASMYVAVFVVVCLAAVRGSGPRWATGIAVALVATAGIALVSRFFPGSFSLRGLPSFLPGSRNRLSFPVDYWNGLAILTALALPLLLGFAVGARRALVRGMAAAPLPAFAAVVYLASSRGGVAVAVAGALAFLALARRRWAAAAALALAAVSSAAAVAILFRRNELVNGSLSSDGVAAQGRSAAILLVLLCAATAVVWAAVSSLFPHRANIHPAVGRGVLVAAALAAVVGMGLSDPGARLEAFKTLPSEVSYEQGEFARAHLLSGAGSGRWQFWSAAAAQFRAHPLTGGGAGTYESWWAERGSFAYFTRDAHSLYAEVLGELGLVGLLLLAGALGCATAAGVRHVLKLPSEERDVGAGVAAAGIAFLVGAGIDWMWELTVVSIVGIACLALVAGRCFVPVRRLESPEPAAVAAHREARRFGLAAGGVALAWVALFAQGAILLADVSIRSSQRAAERRAYADAEERAMTARALTPWAATPHVQLALVAEEAGDLRLARREIEQAARRDPRDWRIWLLSARILTRAGAIDEARRSLARARELNPRSALFGGS